MSSRWPTRRSGPHRSRLLAVALAGVLGLAACSGGSSQPTTAPPGASTASTAPSPTASSVPPSGAADLSSFYAQKLSWQGCGGDFECTTLRVPLDYADPAGEDISIAVIRLPATGKDRLGSLLLNPGGPGGSGINYARAARAVISDPLRARYDVVGFDPRGVGESTPLKCLDDDQIDTLLSIDGSPDTPAEEQALVKESQLLGQECEKRAPGLTAHVSTVEVAKDLDMLRAALGDEKLTYLGASYGTYIGAVYQSLFPDKVGRLVLDGALDPTSTTDEVNLGQATGFERNLDAYIDDCLRDRDCPLPGPRAAAVAKIGALLDQLDRAPLTTEQGRPLTQALAVLGLIYPLYSPQLWPQLTDSLRAAFGGAGTGLLSSADAYADRGPNGYESNSNEVNYAVNCLDNPEPAADLAKYRADAARLKKAAPLLGEYLAWSSLPCAYWPAKAEFQPGPIAAPGTPPILVVGTTDDPATPYVWSVALAKELSSGVLLTNVGDGHTAYRTGNACIDSAVDRYLLTGEPPKDGTRCG